MTPEELSCVPGVLVFTTGYSWERRIGKECVWINNPNGPVSYIDITTEEYGVVDVAQGTWDEMVELFFNDAVIFLPPMGTPDE